MVKIQKAKKEKTDEELEIEKIQSDAQIKKLKVESKFGKQAKKRLAKISTVFDNYGQLNDLTDEEFDTVISNMRRILQLAKQEVESQNSQNNPK